MLYSIFKNNGVSKIRMPKPIKASGIRIATNQERMTVIFMRLIVVDFACVLCYPKTWKMQMEDPRL